MKLVLKVCTIMVLQFLASTHFAVADDSKKQDDEVTLCDNKDVNNGECTTTDNKKNEEEVFQCGLYLAPSTIPNAGFGIYTTRSIAQNEFAQPYPEAPSIPIIDFEYHGHSADELTHTNYIWNADGAARYEADKVSESVMTFGSLCNFHTGLKNLEPYPSGYDDTILNRFKDPGAGAVSYHTGRQFVATRDIEAGEELFDDYGEPWLDGREGYAKFVPRESDFLKTAKVISKLQKSTKEQYKEHDLSMIAEIISEFSERSASIFPRKMTEFDILMKEAKEINSQNKTMETLEKELVIMLAKANIITRDVEWIQNNGICIEKIRPGPSTIAQAGRGAFAQVEIKTGDMIAPAPLLSISKKDALNIYETELDSEEREVINSEKNSSQLLMNYCFGHMESQLLLCPQTNAILINHCGNRENGNVCNNGNGPNAIARWASGWDTTSDEWLQKSMEFMVNMTADGMRGLSLEIIATANIAPGEEVFIDYGENWEKAWDHHVKNWEPPSTDDDYIPLQELIATNDFRTIEEQKENPYPSNILVLCYGGRVIDNLIKKEKESVTVVNGTEGFDDRDYLGNLKFYLPCDIHEINHETKEFKVEMKHDNHSFLVTNFPSEFTTLTIEQYSSDVHLQGAFRHFIEIDDAIFPDSWKTPHE